MYNYDLQIHTNRSDGDHPLQVVINKCKAAGLEAVSITDHNIAEGCNEFAQLCRDAGLQAISGIEISCKYQGFEVHILGYSLDFDEHLLGKKLQSTRDGYDERSKEIIQKINQSGLAYLDFAAIKARKGSGTCVVKYDIAQALASILKKPARDLQKSMSRGGPYFVPYGDWALSPVEAIQLIHQAKGIAIFSHPGETRTKMGQATFDQLLGSLSEAGLDGLEAYSSKHSLEEQQEFARLAGRDTYLITGGSDYHGEKHHPEISLGSGGLTKEQFSIVMKYLQ